MMFFGTRLGYVLFVPFLLVLSAVGQAGGGVPADLRERVLDLLFRSDAVSAPFFSKMTLRYGDSDSQLVVVTYPVYPVHPGGQAEVISYTITGMGSDNLAQFISKMAAQNPNVTDQEIAAKLKVEVKRSPISYEALKRFLDELEAIRMELHRIDPCLPSFVNATKQTSWMQHVTVNATVLVALMALVVYSMQFFTPLKEGNARDAK